VFAHDGEGAMILMMIFEGSIWKLEGYGIMR
jgi:hypothetical protein